MLWHSFYITWAQRKYGYTVTTFYSCERFSLSRVLHHDGSRTLQSFRCLQLCGFLLYQHCKHSKVLHQPTDCFLSILGVNRHYFRMQHSLIGIYNPDECLISPTFTNTVSIVLVNTGDSIHVKTAWNLMLQLDEYVFYSVRTEPWHICNRPSKEVSAYKLNNMNNNIIIIIIHVFGKVITEIQISSVLNLLYIITKFRTIAALITFSYK